MWHSGISRLYWLWKKLLCPFDHFLIIKKGFFHIFIQYMPPSACCKQKMSYLKFARANGILLENGTFLPYDVSHWSFFAPSGPIFTTQVHLSGFFITEKFGSLKEKWALVGNTLIICFQKMACVLLIIFFPGFSSSRHTPFESSFLSLEAYSL